MLVSTLFTAQDRRLLAGSKCGSASVPAQDGLKVTRDAKEILVEGFGDDVCGVVTRGSAVHGVGQVVRTRTRPPVAKNIS